MSLSLEEWLLIKKYILIPNWEAISNCYCPSTNRRSLLVAFDAPLDRACIVFFGPTPERCERALFTVDEWNRDDIHQANKVFSTPIGTYIRGVSLKTKRTLLSRADVAIVEYAKSFPFYNVLYSKYKIEDRAKKIKEKKLAKRSSHFSKLDQYIITREIVKDLIKDPNYKYIIELLLAALNSSDMRRLIKRSVDIDSTGESLIRGFSIFNPEIVESIKQLLTKSRCEASRRIAILHDSGLLNASLLDENERVRKFAFLKKLDKAGHD